MRRRWVKINNGEVIVEIPMDDKTPYEEWINDQRIKRLREKGILESVITEEIEDHKR